MGGLGDLRSLVREELGRFFPDEHDLVPVIEEFQGAAELFQGYPVAEESLGEGESGVVRGGADDDVDPEEVRAEGLLQPSDPGGHGGGAGTDGPEGHEEAEPLEDGAGFGIQAEDLQVEELQGVGVDDAVPPVGAGPAPGERAVVRAVEPVPEVVAGVPDVRRSPHHAVGSVVDFDLLHGGSVGYHKLKRLL